MFDLHYVPGLLVTANESSVRIIGPIVLTVPGLCNCLLLLVSFLPSHVLALVAVPCARMPSGVVLWFCVVPRITVFRMF